MAEAAAAAGVAIVTGDTKVVDRGAADGMYISTAGRRADPAGRDCRPHASCAGDVVLVSGHDRRSRHGRDARPRRPRPRRRHLLGHRAANGLVEALLAAAPSTRWLRDATRGGVGTVCNELARDADLTVVLEESSLPMRPAVTAACELLGIDPLYVANEGKLVAVVAPEEADAALAALTGHPSAPTPSASARSARSRPASSCSSRPSVAPASWTCSSVTPCPASADRRFARRSGRLGW